MSLDATIVHVERDGQDVVLTLGPRIDWEEKLSTAGQTRMRIMGATWDPEPGMDLWGGDGYAFIIPQSGPTRHYERDCYTRLLEAHPFTVAKDAPEPAKESR